MVNQTIGAGPGIDKADAIYNDVQCGNGPANDVGDEIVGECPGRVDMGGAGCGTIGYGWFDYLVFFIYRFLFSSHCDRYTDFVYTDLHCDVVTCKF